MGAAPIMSSLTLLIMGKSNCILILFVCTLHLGACAQTKSVTPFSKVWVSGDSTRFSHLHGQEQNGKRVGTWVFEQWTSADTNRRITELLEYHKGVDLIHIRYQENGIVITSTRNRKNVPLLTTKTRNDTLVSRVNYTSANHRTSEFYHPNGVLESKGAELRGYIQAGCDAGLPHWYATGTWKYYTPDGKRERDEAYDRPSRRQRTNPLRRW